MKRIQKLKKYLDDGFTLWTYAYGASMSPIISEGEKIKLKKKNSPYEVNDIVVIYDGMGLVAHMIYGIYGPIGIERIYDIRGYKVEKPYWVLERHIIGYVECIYQV